MYGEAPFPYIDPSWDEPYPYSWNVDHDTHFDMVKYIQDVILETTRYMDEYYELVRRAGGKQWTIIHQITEIVVESQDHFKWLTLKA